MTVTLGAPKLPLVLPPAETRAGDIVIADIGIPGEVIDGLDGPRVELLTRGVDARADHAARRRTATRATTAASLIVAGSRGQDRRGAPVGDRRAALGRRPRDGRDAGVAASRSSRRWRRST